MSGQIGHSILSNPPARMFEDYDDDESSSSLSTVHVSVATPIHITGDNNLISVDPGLAGSKMALAIIAGLKQMSGTAGGVPMIDEDGRPRPIKVEIKADTKIEGSKNVIGEKAVYSMMAASTLKKFGEARDISKKRDRSDDESPDTDPKRAKAE